MGFLWVSYGFPMVSCSQVVGRGIPFSDRPVELRGDFVELPKIRARPGVGPCRLPFHLNSTIYSTLIL